MVFLTKKCLIPFTLQHLGKKENQNFMGEMGKRYEQVTSFPF